MAERIILEIEVQEILCHIDNGDNFLLSGGAGSGKTYSLVQVIRQVIEENPNCKVACMTYTNAAVKEIEERVNHKNLIVSTIHEFLWDTIEHFQKELKSSLIELMNDEESKIKNPGDTVVPTDYFDELEKRIQYKEYLKIKEGIISHDEILILANHLFKTYPKLCDILKDKFKFIFIDEYQDTSKSVVEIFLTHIKQSSKKNIIGFFGDSMQSIYDDTVENLDEYKGDEEGKVKEVIKPNNWRNPDVIIQLANKLRNDEVVQSSSYEPPKQGSLKFYYSTNSDIVNLKTQIGWDFSDSKKTKILNLTHNLIAPNAGFKDLMEIYDKDPVLGLKKDILEKIKSNKKNQKPEIPINDIDTFDEVVDKFKLKNIQKELKKEILIRDYSILYNQLKDLPFSVVRKIYLDKDQLVDDKKQDQDDENKKGSKRDDLIKHLFKIQNNISLYRNQQYNEFVRKTEYKIVSIEDKKILKERIDELSDVQSKSIEEIINKADEYGICKKDDKLQRFILEKEYVFNRVREIEFSEFQNLYNYLEGNTPFSTQHKTKGSEFDNVLVILDNGGWNNYNFEKMFIGGSSKSVETRTKKIFYVCCTRAKENLAVFFHNPSQAIITKANEWFGEDNVVRIE